MCGVRSQCNGFLDELYKLRKTAFQSALSTLVKAAYDIKRASPGKLKAAEVKFYADKADELPATVAGPK